MTDLTTEKVEIAIEVLSQISIPVVNPEGQKVCAAASVIVKCFYELREKLSKQEEAPLENGEDLPEDTSPALN